MHGLMREGRRAPVLYSTLFASDATQQGKTGLGIFPTGHLAGSAYWGIKMTEMIRALRVLALMLLALIFATPLAAATPGSVVA